MKNEGKVAILFDSGRDYMAYREIISQRITMLETTNANLPAVKEAVSVLKFQKTLCDAILGNIFIDSIASELEKGIKINPILFPELMTDSSLMNSTQLLQRAIGEAKILQAHGADQKVLEFKDPTEISVESLSSGKKTVVGLAVGSVPADDVEKAILATLNSGGRTINGLIQGAQVYAHHNNINIEEKGMYGILEELTSKYPRVGELPLITGIAKWLTTLVEESNNPVPAFFQLHSRLKDKDLSENVIGQTLQWLVYKHAKSLFVEGKHKLDNGKTLENYYQMVDGPYYLADPEKYTVKLNKNILNQIMNDTNTRSIIENFVRVKNELGKDAPVEFQNGEYERLVQTALDCTSPCRQEQLRERRKKKLEGKLESKPYEEKGYPA